MSQIQSARSGLTDEIASLKEEYKDVEGFSTKDLEDVGAEYDTNIADAQKGISAFDTDIKSYVTQWQQAAQMPEQVWGVRALGNTYQTPSQAFGRKERNKRKTQSNQFTLDNIASTWGAGTINV